MNFVKKTVLALVAAAGMATAAQAATFTINPIISAQYNASGVLQAGALGSGVPIVPLTSGIYAVDLYLKFSNGGTAADSFGNLTYDLTPSGGVSRLAADTGATAKRNEVFVNTQFDSDGDSAADTRYTAQNLDTGSDWISALLGIDTTVDTSAFTVTDPRATIGQTGGAATTANGYLFARAFVNWNGSQAGQLTLHEYPVGVGSDPSIWHSPVNGGNNGLVSGGNVSDGIALFPVGATPEPASLGFLAVGGLMALRRRRA